tara:strand:- start:336 stop:842 length:507 start_codon:yes stop_codon:yes gene_type:complete
MPKGLKTTSSLITIGFSVTESGANTFTQGQVDLQLNPLDNEVFVVQAVNLDPSNPDAIAGTSTNVDGALTTTSRTAMPNLSDSAALAVASNAIRADAVVGVGFSKTSMETPPAALEYIGIIATNDFFIQVLGTNNVAVKKMTGKLYGYRARADASVYAALVQSEVLSS